MARHDIDPALQQLVRVINEWRQATVPVTVPFTAPCLPVPLIANAGTSANSSRDIHS